MTDILAHATDGQAGAHGLKKDAIGFSDGLTIALASTAPVIGAALLGHLFVKALIDYSDPADSYTGVSWFGVAPPAEMRPDDVVAAENLQADEPVAVPSEKDSI